MLTHLKTNIVGYLALVVALGGTSYAAGVLPRDSVGEAQIRAGAVRSAEVADRTLRATDFAYGQLPRGPRGPQGATGPSWVAVSSSVIDPSATFEGDLGTAFTFDVPRSGTVLVEIATGSIASACSAGSSRVGLYVDGDPLPGTGLVPSSTFAAARTSTLRAVVRLPAGEHVAVLGFDCPTGDLGNTQVGPVSWKVQLVGGS